MTVDTLSEAKGVAGLLAVSTLTVLPPVAKGYVVLLEHPEAVWQEARKTLSTKVTFAPMVTWGMASRLSVAAAAPSLACNVVSLIHMHCTRSDVSKTRMALQAKDER
jgi:hypothetical protein